MERIEARSNANRRSLAAGLVVVGSLSRLLPHPPNMTCVGATGLFSGARLKLWQALLLCLSCMALTDPILARIHGYAPFTWETIIIYSSLVLNVFIGRAVIKTGSPARIGLAAVAGSSQFFVVTNFFVWASYGLYPHTWAGLTTCYIAALPFFGWTLAGDLSYTAILFGIYSLVAGRVFRPLAASAHESLAD